MSRRRRWLRLAAAALAGGAVLGAAPPTAAVPAGLPAGVPAGVPAAVPGSRAAPADTDLPVTVTVTGLEPRDIRPDSAVIVAAVLRNTGREATGPLRIRLQRGTRMTTRGELARADTDPPPTGALTTPGVPVGEGLPAGGSRTVRYESSAAALALGGLGVYPLALSVVDASGTEVGRTETLLPYFPPDIDPVRTRVALFWPLLDRPHRLTGPHASTASAGQLPVFDDDLLARAVSPAGRLDRLLTLAEKVTGSVRLTIAVDPETIDELQTMVSGYRVAASGGRLSTPGRGGPAAAVWLARLKKIAPDHLLMVVPYGDPDVVAMERGGLGWLAQLEAPDADAVGRVLGVRPTTDLAWPPDGQLTDTTLDDVVRQGTDAVVLDPTALPGGRSPEEGATQSGVSPLPALEGQAVALVPDAALQRLVAAGADRRNPYAGGARLAEQRLLAELAMITAERPNDVRTLVIAPPRRWDPSPAYAAAVLRDLSTLRWLDSTTALEAAQ
ncbi:MAG TPA: DUF6049 family protein, partial [Mycobacteriales bacterium]